MDWGARTSIDHARDHLKTYLGAGGDFVDTAHRYADGASEEILGAMLGDLVPRDQLVICTKAGISRRTGTRVVDTSRRALMHQLDTSLERLTWTSGWRTPGARTLPLMRLSRRWNGP